MSTAAPALEVRELSVRFGGVVAVDDVSFAVERGSITGLIGPNGAGKTTILDAVSGFVPSTGTVLLEGRDVSALGSTARGRAGFGRSFQDGRLFPSLTVTETLAVALERHAERVGPLNAAVGVGPSRTAERDVAVRAADLIELVGLVAYRDKFCDELSTGTRRIVDLACAIAHAPHVLLLDEPSSGIAQRETEALGPLLRRIRDMVDCTIVVIEHDMPLVSSVSDELIALETGRIIARGKPRRVLAAPAVVAAYLGAEADTIQRSGSRRAKPRARPARKAGAKPRAKPARKAKLLAKPARKAGTKRTTRRKTGT
jgi:ABC-type branched-subunit amino acid transport system ATPase component